MGFKLKKNVDKFWFGILIGFVSGLLGNIWVEMWFRAGDDLANTPNVAGAFTATILLVVMFLFLQRMSIPEK